MKTYEKPVVVYTELVTEEVTTAGMLSGTVSNGGRG